jgi:hypothetical protein
MPAARRQLPFPDAVRNRPSEGNLDQIGDMAAAAEAAGWDGVFYWDAVHIPDYGAMYDPWVALTVIATRTKRVRLGGIVMALPRHRPWLFARAATSVDHVSHGRLVLPIGLGALDDTGFGGVGEVTETKIRAERMDEALAILEGLWTARPFSFQGTHFQMAEMTFEPPPVQRPRIPIWVVGAWPREKSMQRVLRYDGILPNKLDDAGKQATLEPADLAAIRDYVVERRGSLGGFDIIAEGKTNGDNATADAEIVRPWADAGATWWIDADWGADVDRVRRRVELGPPRISR